MKTELCPECNYPLEIVVDENKSPKYVCALCGHVERVPPSYEFARSCIGNPIPKNPE